MQFHVTKMIKKKKKEGEKHTVLPPLLLSTFLLSPTAQEFWSSMCATLKRSSSLSLQKTNAAKRIPIFLSIRELNQLQKGPT